MEYTVRENSRSILERDKILRSLKKYERIYPWGLCWRKVWKTTLFTILLALTWELRYFWKWGTIKMMCWNRRFKHLSTLSIGVSKKFHLNFSLCFSDNIAKCCKVYTKTDSWFQKSYKGFGQFQASSEKTNK